MQSIWKVCKVNINLTLKFTKTMKNMKGPVKNKEIQLLQISQERNFKV